MPTYDFVTLDVFTDRRFGGNPLAVFPDARGMSGEDMQSLAAEFNLSETTFVLPPKDPAHSAQVRIFNRTAEMPFAGHPNVGTGYVLAELGRDTDGALVFEELAGLVQVKVERDGAGRLTGAAIAAPQALSTGFELTAEQVAQCCLIEASDVITVRHRPRQASVGVDFVFAEVTAEGLAKAGPNLAGSREVAATIPQVGDRLSIHLYVRDGDQLRVRMFAPLSGTFEDAATGSANATLAALLLSLDGGETAAFVVSQGVEMGRPSRLKVTAHRAADGIRATVGGGCAPMFRGQVTL
jgi:trans-2,3-dihydro-3-hydroxyanthranilate isomerase